MVCNIIIQPCDAGWALKADGADNEMLFRSGEKAETAARALGRRLSEQGQTVRIEIWTRDGKLAGRFAIPPAPIELALAG